MPERLHQEGPPQTAAHPVVASLVQSVVRSGRPGGGNHRRSNVDPAGPGVLQHSRPARRVRPLRLLPRLLHLHRLWRLQGRVLRAHRHLLPAHLPGYQRAGRRARHPALFLHRPGADRHGNLRIGQVQNIVLMDSFLFR